MLMLRLTNTTGAPRVGHVAKIAQIEEMVGDHRCLVRRDDRLRNWKPDLELATRVDRNVFSCWRGSGDRDLEKIRRASYTAKSGS